MPVLGLHAQHRPAAPDVTMVGADTMQGLPAGELYVDGRPAPWPGRAGLPYDSLATAIKQVVADIRQEGYYFARLDSVVERHDGAVPLVQFYLQRGPEVRLGEVRIEGAQVLDAAALLQRMDTRPGQRLDPDVLEADLEALLARYERAGHALAQVRIQQLALSSEEPPTLALVLRVQEGPALRLSRVELVGTARTQTGLVKRVAELKEGEPLEAYDPEAIQRRLEETGWFRSVAVPQMLVEPDSGVVLRIELEEEPPGLFDLVFGYLPPAGEGTSGTVVGNGHLVLRNLFGGGRLLSLKLNRLPGQVSSVDVRASDPFVLGLPFRLEGRFQGLQQDSTYGKQQFGGEVGYRFSSGFEALGTLTRETTRPGQAGIGLGRDGLQRIARAEAWFFGLGLRLQRLDQRVNPRKGIFLEMNAERGRKERTLRRRLVEGDTLVDRSLLRQERVRGQGRFFIPTFRRQVLLLGGDVALLSSNAYDLSDLFRLGGATTLRGYDEDRFRGRFVARALAEYRYQLDRSSYTFAFFDLGYVDRPALDETPARQSFQPGYGFGLQFGTALGLVTASYAISPEGSGPLSGRVHVGLSFGL